MKLLNFLVIRLSLFFLLGIYLGLQFSFPPEMLFLSLSMGVFLLVVFHLIYYRSFKNSVVFSVFAPLIFVLIGISASTIQKPENQANHLVHFVSETNEQWIHAEVEDILKPTAYAYKYVVKVHQVNRFPTQGKVLLQIAKEQEEDEFSVGDALIFKTDLQTFEDPKNPQSFNYKSFMENRLILFQARPKAYVHQANTNTSTLYSGAAKLRKRIQQDLAQAGFNDKQMGLIQALLLGQKRQIGGETYANFAKAGVVHILAVSGLHVGIVLLLLQWVFKPIDYLRNGRIFKTLIIIALLWGFALIAGFSPSVTRAVTMFTAFAFAINMKRKTNTINILCISLFPILMLKPNFLLEVGFQLSYAAVFSIVMLQPKLYRLYLPKTYVDKTLWSVFTVTTSAQLGVLPFSLFYFNQFPGLFIIANMVIIPFLGILIGGGMVVILLAFWDILPKFLVQAYSFLLDLLERFVEWVAQKEDFVFKEIFFNFSMFICLMLMIWCLLFYVRSKKYSTIIGFFVGLIGLTWAYALASQKHQTSAEFIIFNEMRNSLFGFKKGKQFTLYFSDSLQQPTEFYSIKSFSTLNNIQDFSIEKPRPFYHFNSNEILLVVDSTGIYPTKTKNAYVYLTHSPKVNLERLIQNLEPKEIIADANNYRSFVQQW